ncbi:MAG: ferritin-like domain-containing protein [Candidatus Protochlamydia sp.]|nr:ferritin-like domain-containing protein [Candidatus Protochlamydia sp.]
MKKDPTLYSIFIDELEDMLSCENQIIEALQKMIKLASSEDLIKAFSDHLEETEIQVKRLENIFSLLELPPKEKKCKGMEGILKEGDEMFKGKTKDSLLDAILISAAQKVEHYEIASYGTLRSFASQLDLDKEIVDLIQENLKEEGAADKKLTKIADGSIFSDGINTQAAEPAKHKK